MYTVRVQNRLQQAYRVCRAAPTPYTTTRDMALFPRLIANDFAPLFRLADDYASHVATRGGFQSAFANSIRSFHPRFDVKETSDAYELHGELPGVDQKDINIEFTDAQTLSIKGRTETRREEGTRPGADAHAASVEAQPEVPAVEEAKAASEAGESTPSESSSSYHKPTVEDDAEYAFVDSPSETPAAPAEAEKAVAAAPTPVAPAPEPKQPEDSSRYWVSERSVGTFHRSFAFPGRVDLENVKASLKDGILSVVIPKATAQASRRVQIQ